MVSSMQSMKDFKKLRKIGYAVNDSKQMAFTLNSENQTCLAAHKARVMQDIIIKQYASKMHNKMKG